MMKKILIVDDNDANLYLLKSLLEEEGFTATAARNGQEALESARADLPDLIISDILMPVMDGYLFCRKCKEDEQLRQIPFIFYTATYTEPKDEQFALQLGADRFVLKPQEPEVLLSLLEEVWEENVAKKPATPKPLGEEMEFFRHYNEILFTKLEKKMLDLETAYRKLKCLEEQYRLSFENVTDIVWTIDTDLIVGKMSPSVERMLGYKPQDFIGRSVSELLKTLSPESMARAMTDIHTILQGRTIPGAVYSIVAKNGAVREVEISGAPIRRNGDIIGMASVIRDITERWQVEAAMRESDEKYRCLFENFQDAVLLTQPDGSILEANQAACEMFGRSLEELRVVGRSGVVDLTDPRLTPALEERAQKGNVRAEITLLRANGEKFLADITSTVFTDRNGQLKSSIIIRDITERKKAEEALRESEDRYRSVFQDHSAVKFLIDPYTGSIVEANAAAENYYGWSQGQLKQMKIQEINTLPPDDLKRDMDQALSRKQSHFEFRHRRADGSIRDVEVFSGKIEVKGKTLLHSIIHDISERKRAEENLRKSEARFRSYFELPLIGIAVSSPEKGWLEGNERLSAILGYAWQELRGMTWSELTYPEDLDADVAQFDRLLSGEIDSYMLDKRFIRKDGTAIWTSLAAGCVRKENGEVDYVVALLEDITDRKESTNRLRKSLSATIQAMAVAVETRDPYTAGHQRRVADLARAIATEMRLSDDRINGVLMAAVVHDIGKLSVPAELLSTPRKLTDIEFNLIKTHPRSGYDILKDIQFPWPIAQMVFEHHERMDGSGYPQGLTGEDILFESRILSIADVVEAMASHRPYRPTLGLESALDEISRNRGARYDADAVDVCLRLFRDKHYQFID